MPAHPPRLCFDKTLHRFYVKWGGRRRWLGTDKPTAQALHAAEVSAWGRWRGDRELARVHKRQRPQLTIAQLYAQFIEARELEGTSTYTLDFYRHSLKRFLWTWGRHRADDFSVRELHAFKQTLLQLGLAPKTINHHLGCIRTLLRWGGDLELCDTRNLRGCKSVATAGNRKPKAWTPIELRRVLGALPERARAWAVVQYLCAMRPSETLRLVHGQGDWPEDGVFCPWQSKSEWRSKQPRHVVVCPYALEWLERCEPRYGRLDSYRNAFARAGIAGGSHPLRHTAATHLLGTGAARAEVDLFLGHLPPRVSTTYAPIEWQPLRLLAEGLRVHLKGVA